MLWWYQKMLNMGINFHSHHNDGPPPTIKAIRNAYALTLLPMQLVHIDARLPRFWPWPPSKLIHNVSVLHRLCSYCHYSRE